jgi:hypothetical protein
MDTRGRSWHSAFTGMAPDDLPLRRQLARDAIRVVVLALLAAAISSVIIGARAASQGTDVEPVATYRGKIIPLEEVALHHCHDGAYPVIRCFDTEEERDEDASHLGVDATRAVAEGRGGRTAGPAADGLLILYYVTFYQNASYGGASFTASQPQPDLQNFGWNDVISSFKSLNSQRPKWWEHIGYVAPAWRWSAGAWVSYVGDGANDRFSSAKNVP